MHAPFKIPVRKTPTFKSISEFEKGRTLGNGAFASVMEAMHLATKKKYAIKQVNLLKIAPVDYENVLKELEIHSRVSSPFLVKMFDFWKEGAVVYIVLELCPGGNLYRFMNTNTLTEAEIRRFFVQTVLGIKYLHSQGVIMRDLKPENVVLDARGNAKICDFGWAADLKDVAYCSIKAGTYAYMSPESLSGTLQMEKSDVWSLGVLLYELMFNKEPYLGKSCSEMLRVIKSTELDLSGKGIPSGKELVAQLLKYNVKDRPGMKHILNSQFFQESLLGIDPASFKKEAPPVAAKGSAEQAAPPPAAPVLAPSQSTPAHQPRTQVNSPAPNIFVRNANPVFKPIGMPKADTLTNSQKIHGHHVSATPNPSHTPLVVELYHNKVDKPKPEIKRSDNPLFKPLLLQSTRDPHSNTSFQPARPARDMSEPHKLQPQVINSTRVMPTDPKSFLSNIRPTVGPMTTAHRDQRPAAMTPNPSSNSRQPLFTPLFKDPPSTIKRNVSETHFSTPNPERTALPPVKYTSNNNPPANAAPVEERKARRIDQMSHCSFVNDPGTTQTQTQRTTAQVSHSPSITFTRHFSFLTPPPQSTHPALGSSANAHPASMTPSPSQGPSSYHTSLLSIATQRALPRSNVIITHQDTKKLNLSMNENSKPINRPPDIPTERNITVLTPKTPGNYISVDKGAADHNIYAKTKIQTPSAPEPSVTKIVRQKTLPQGEDGGMNIYQGRQKISVAPKFEVKKTELKMSFGGSIQINRK